MTSFYGVPIDVIINLTLAMLLGMVVGTERLFAHKTASMRTYALVAMGSALFAIITDMASTMYANTFASINPLLMTAQIITGVGFLGAGVIFVKNNQLQGITSASGLWVVAGIGMAAGFGFHGVAIVTTLLTLFIFVVLWFIEQHLKRLNLTIDTDKQDSG